MGIGVSDYFAPVTSTLTQLPLCTNLTHIPSRYTGCAKMTCVNAIESYRITDRHKHMPSKIILHAVSLVVRYSSMGGVRLDNYHAWLCMKNAAIIVLLVLIYRCYRHCGQNNAVRRLSYGHVSNSWPEPRRARSVP